MSAEQSLEERRAKLTEEALDSALAKIREKADYYERRAKQQRHSYAIARTIAVVLGVLAPTVVAFQANQILGQYAALWSLFAIIITTGTGIVTGLQASFKWGEGYARSTTTNFQLGELAGSIQLESLLYRTTPDYGLKSTELKRLYDKAWQQMQSIIKAQTQAEVALIEPSPKAEPSKKEPSTTEK